MSQPKTIVGSLRSVASRAGRRDDLADPLGVLQDGRPEVAAQVIPR